DVAGDVASTLPGAPAYAFLHRAGSTINLGTLGGDRSESHGISDAGQVVGDAQTSAGISHAFLYQDSVMQDLGTLGGATSVAYGISRCNGLIVGQSDTSSGGSHAFLFGDGAMHDLGTLGGPSSSARAVNPSGQIVGLADTSDTVP